MRTRSYLGFACLLFASVGFADEARAPAAPSPAALPSIPGKADPSPAPPAQSAQPAQPSKADAPTKSDTPVKVTPRKPTYTAMSEAHAWKVKALLNEQKNLELQVKPRLTNIERELTAIRSLYRIGNEDPVDLDETSATFRQITHLPPAPTSSTSPNPASIPVTPASIPATPAARVEAKPAPRATKKKRGSANAASGSGTTSMTTTQGSSMLVGSP